MAARSLSSPLLAEPVVKSKSRSPSRNQKKNKIAKNTNYTSDGVADHDIFLLPGSDYQVMGLLTVIGAIVRLFRIYQPSSVVFDEVQ